jgi:dolichol-phosphate mannosyltransferase
VRISVVVPVFAETESLALVVRGLFEVAGPWIEEVLIVQAPAAPASTRRVCTELSAHRPGVRVVEQSRSPGLGWAVRQGVAEARGSHILMIDGDGEMDVATVPLLMSAMVSRDADLVVASRWMEGGGAVGYPRGKRLLNRSFQRIFRILYRTPLHDLTLGFKLARADHLKQLAWRSQFHEVACESTLRMVRRGYRVVEVPTVWRRREQGSSNNPFHRNLRYLVLAVVILLERRPVAR